MVGHLKFNVLAEASGLNMSVVHRVDPLTAHFLMNHDSASTKCCMIVKWRKPQMMHNYRRSNNYVLEKHVLLIQRKFSTPLCAQVTCIPWCNDFQMFFGVGTPRQGDP